MDTMDTMERLNTQLASLDAATAEAERRAADAPDDEALAGIGALLAGLAAKRRSLVAALAEATGRAAARERQRAEAQAEAERAAVLARARTLQSDWRALLREFDDVATTLDHLWTRYAALRAADAAVLADVQRLGLLARLDGYDVGALSGALLDAKRGAGVLAWRG